MSLISQKPRLIIFAKAPYLGGAKSRLAAGIGKVHANRLYRAMTREILRNVSDPRWKVIIAATPDRDAGKVFGGVWPHEVPRALQGGGDLSARLSRAFDHKGITIVIGTDAPQIRAKDIADAIKALKHKRAVFGRADDGGFWLIGMRGPVGAHVFDAVNWSTDSALSDVVNNLGGEAAYLRTLIDVDDIEALAKLRAQKKRAY